MQERSGVTTFAIQACISIVVGERQVGEGAGATPPMVRFRGIFGISFLRVNINTLLCNPNLIHSENPFSLFSWMQAINRTILNLHVLLSHFSYFSPLNCCTDHNMQHISTTGILTQVQTGTKATQAMHKQAFRVSSISKTTSIDWYR